MSHSKLPKRDGFLFHPKEVALLGISCEEINSVFQELRKNFSSKKIVLIDGTHDHNLNSQQALVFHKDHFSLEMNGSSKTFENFALLHALDTVVVNGNHFAAREHILFCDPSKRGTLLRRQDQLKRISAVVLSEGMDSVPEDVLNVIPNKDFSVLYSKNELFDFFEKDYLSAPPLKALVLTGGESLRMGTDKSQLNYHGVPQWKFLEQEVLSSGIPVFFSVRKATGIDRPELEDRFVGMGALGGIMSAMLEHPGHAFLIIACDMPNIDRKTITALLEQRSASQFATCFYNEHKGWAEPLFAIWEPKSLHAMLHYLALGKSCPRKLLSELDIHSIIPGHSDFLINVNTPEERSDWFKERNI